MRKMAALFFMALFLCYMLTNSARPEPAFEKGSLAVTQHQVGYILLLLLVLALTLHHFFISSFDGLIDA